MESISDLFFHTVFGVVLFVTAISGLVMNARGVISFAQMQQRNVGNKVMCETEAQGENQIVKGEWVLFYAMEEGKTDTKISFLDGTDCTIHRKSKPEEIIDMINARESSFFQIMYEYESDGKLKAVCFNEQRQCEE